jgi:serine/threonine-protein kinase
LANRYRLDHARAERERQNASRLEVLLEQHLAALPSHHPDVPSLQTYLKGDGALTLLTEPPGAEVLIYRHTQYQRRLVPQIVGSAGHTPLRAYSLPAGSYLCVLRLEGYQDVHYPVFIGRNEHWDGVPPRGTAPTPIRLPKKGELGPDDCYIPPGWFWSGAEEEFGPVLPSRRLWADGWVVRRFPVTNHDYLAFLNALVTIGEIDRALSLAPRERGRRLRDVAECIYAFNGQEFSLQRDADGDFWLPEWPVFMVSWRSARAYADHKRRTSAGDWSLLPELIWEKAGRGVDGRIYPWGDQFDPSRACMQTSKEGANFPVPVQDFPIDESVYGVRGMAGNVREFCADVYTREGPSILDSRVGPPLEERWTGEISGRRVSRGGAWADYATRLRLTHRDRPTVDDRYPTLGFRIGRPYGV